MDHFNADSFPSNICINFSSGNTVDLNTKEIFRRKITSKDWSNLQFTLLFSCAYDLIDSVDTSACRITTLVTLLDQSV